jgi:hypothetical protein
MLDNITGGVTGLILFISHWLSPSGEQASLTIADIARREGAYEISCQLKIGWNEQLADLVDAGIPMRFRFEATSDDGRAVRVLRTLQCDITDYTYRFVDSLRSPPRDSVWTSPTYRQILIAMRHFTRWTFTVDSAARQCRVEMTLLPSRAPRLNRSVDFSNVCGCKKLSKTVVIRE